MATGRSMQLTKQAGEYFVAAELCRRGLISTTFTGNVPAFDILAVNNKHQTFAIQVKTIRKGDWQLDAKKFLKISISNKTQKVHGKTKLYPNLIGIFVRLKENSRKEDEFYICKIKDIQKIISDGYKWWLSKQKGVRPRTSTSTHCILRPNDLQDYEDKWEIITK